MASEKNPINNAAIKVEPGISPQRLPSLKPPRDLSLSAFSSKMSASVNQPSKKKVYMPNLNVQRNKNVENSTTVKQEPKESKGRSNLAERGRGRGRGAKRGGGAKNNLIQLDSGLFSEGLAPSLKSSKLSRSGPSGEGGSGERATLQKPKLNFQENTNINKEEEENTIKELLRDDFVDDPNLEPDYDNCPIKLPLVDCKVFSKDVDLKKIKNEPDDSDTVENKGNAVIIDGEVMHIKTEIGEEIENLETKKLKPKVCNYEKKEKVRHIPTVPEVTSSTESQFVLLQLPNCMPGLKPDVEPQRQPQKQGTSSEASSSDQPNREPSTPQEQPRCTLKNLPPGLVGKLQILKSGRTRLVLGDTKMWLEMGTQVAFKQDLISVDLDRTSHTGNTICLGSIPLRMTVCPDWDSMILSQ